MWSNTNRERRRRGEEEKDQDKEEEEKVEGCGGVGRGWGRRTENCATRNPKTPSTEAEPARLPVATARKVSALRGASQNLMRRHGDTLRVPHS